MKRQGGGFGIVILVVVMAVVLVLVAKAWKSLAPSAIEVSTPVGEVGVSDHGQTEAASEVRSGGLPDLNDMKKETDAHSQQVEETLQAIE